MNKHLLTDRVAIIGKKGSGKSTLAKHLTESFYESLIMEDAETIKMADTLKDMCRLFLKDAGFNEEMVERMIEGDIKEERIPYYDFTPRRMMQTLGTQWGRDCLKPSIWRDIWENRVNASESSIICDDVRFDNEVIRAEEMGFKLVRIVSPDTEQNSDEHESERVPNHCADVIILNNKEQPLNFDMTEMLDKVDDLSIDEFVIIKGSDMYVTSGAEKYSMETYKELDDVFYYAEKEYKESLSEDDYDDDAVERWKEEKWVNWKN